MKTAIRNNKMASGFHKNMYYFGLNSSPRNLGIAESMDQYDNLNLSLNFVYKDM